MKICEFNLKTKLSLKKNCEGCGLSSNPKEANLLLEDIIPKNLCPFAYFAIIPYWVSFKQGAWFSWRENKDDVVCQCPKHRGAVFLVKREKENIIADIVDSGICPLKYQKNTNFVIQAKMCPALFSSFWTSIETAIDNNENVIELDCSVSSSKVEIKLNDN